MNSLIAIFLTTILFIFSGWYLTYLLPKIEKIERVGLSFLIGAGLTTYIWYLGNRIGLPFNLLTLVLSGSLLSVTGYGILKVLKLDNSQSSKFQFTKSEIKFAILVIIGLLLAFIIGSYQPLVAWDSLAQYDFRGHAIALDHDLSFIDAGAYYLSYPLMISLVHAVVYMLGGISAQGIHAIIFASFIAVVYGRMKTWTNLKYALLTCLLLIGQKELFDHATFAYTNLPYTAYLVAGILYALSSGSYTLLISAFLIGSSTWVRSSEVFWIVGVLLIIWKSIQGKKIIQAILAILLVMGMRAGWATFVYNTFKSIGFSTDTSVNHINIRAIPLIVSKLPQIYWYLYLNIISPYLGVWFLAVPTLVFIFLKKSQRLLLLFLSITLCAGMVVGGVMIFSTYYSTWNEIGDSARRMMLFVVPLAIITASYALYLADNKEKNDE